MELLETAELQAFVKIVELGSISSAAKLLNLPRATLTRRLARLEEKLERRLIKRTTRSLYMTEAGQALYLHAVAVLDAASLAIASVHQAQDQALSGSLRVSVPPLRDERFNHMIAQFVREHPLVRLQIHYGSAFVDLHRDDYDVVMRAGENFGDNLISKTLLRTEQIAVASPDYLTAHQTPSSPDELAAHRCLLGFRRGELPQTHWPLVGGGEVVVEGHFFSSNLDLIKLLALNAEGIAMLPRQLILKELERGELVQVLEGVLGNQVRVALLYKDRVLMPPQVRAFIDAVIQWASDMREEPW